MRLLKKNKTNLKCILKEPDIHTSMHFHLYRVTNYFLVSWFCLYPPFARSTQSKVWTKLRQNTSEQAVDLGYTTIIRAATVMSVRTYCTRKTQIMTCVGCMNIWNAVLRSFWLKLWISRLNEYVQFIGR